MSAHVPCVASASGGRDAVRVVLRDPVARPWDAQSEYRAYKDTLEQALAGERAGFHAFWTVEHHFLEEYSHCSNPEVLYGAIRRGPRRCASDTASG